MRKHCDPGVIRDVLTSLPISLSSSFAEQWPLLIMSLMLFVRLVNLSFGMAMSILLVSITQPSVFLISVGAPSPDNFLIDKATDLFSLLGRLVVVGLKNNENIFVMMLKHVYDSCSEPDEVSRYADVKSST